MTILVIAEHDNKVLAPATLNTVAAARKSVVTSTCWLQARALAPWLKPRRKSLA